MTPEEITAVAQLAHIDPWPLIHRAREIVASIDEGDPRKTELIVRECCPDTSWDWPEAVAFLQSINKRATRIQLAELVAFRLTRMHLWLRRQEQMLQNIDRRPYWQFRAVGDSRDPPACTALSGRVERYDSDFWRDHAPWHCGQVECRCTVRTFTLAEIAAKGLTIPD